MVLSAPNLAVGLGIYAIVIMVPVGVLWTLIRVHRIGEWTVAVLRRCRVLPKEQPAPRPPVERLAADLRRLSEASRTLPRGTPYARHKGLLLAYDETLVTACRALDVPQVLDTLPWGMDRELERLRVEGALEGAGLRISGPRDHQDTP